MNTWETLRPHAPLRDRLVSHAPAVGAVVTTVGVVLLWASQGGESGVPDPGPVWMVFNLAVFASAVAMLSRWYFLGDAPAAWCAASLLCLGVYFQQLVAVDGGTWPTPLSVVDLGAMAAVVWMVRSGARPVSPTGWWHPVISGVGVGLALAGARALVHIALPQLEEWLVFVAIVLGLPVAAALVASTVLGGEGLAHARQWTLTIATASGFFAYHLVPNAPLSPPVADLAVDVVIVTCTVLLVVNSVHLLQDAYRTHAQRLAELADRATTAEASVHRDEDILHEFRATVAGVDAAIHLLLASSSPLPPDQRESLQRMLDAELGRLRVMAAAEEAEAPEPQVVALDRIIEPVVVAHRVQGAQIDMPTTRISARCSALEVATAVNVLLHNARQHAAGAHIWVEWEQRHQSALVRVRDDGPGIAEDVREVLFGRHAKSSGSPGHGLGLFCARQAILDQGGELTLEPTTRGASFALVLPR